MLHGQRVTLRPLTQDDLPQLWRWLTDAETWLAASLQPLQPLTYGVFEEMMQERVSSHEVAAFAIESEGQLIGSCDISAFDNVARHARIGVTIGERSARGHGLGRDVIDVLCDFGFAKRNLHRLHLNVLAHNSRAIRTYTAAGFVEEGRLREHAWVDGLWIDVLVMGLLRSDWLSRRQAGQERVSQA